MRFVSLFIGCLTNLPQKIAEECWENVEIVCKLLSALFIFHILQNISVGFFFVKPIEYMRNEMKINMKIFTQSYRIECFFRFI